MHDLTLGALCCCGTMTRNGLCDGHVRRRIFAALLQINF